MVYQDVISPIKDVRTYRVNFLLWKEQWDAYIAPSIPLNWKCVKFEEKSCWIPLHPLTPKKGIQQK